MAAGPVLVASGRAARHWTHARASGAPAGAGHAALARARTCMPPWMRAHFQKVLKQGESGASTSMPWPMHTLVATLESA